MYRGLPIIWDPTIILLVIGAVLSLIARYWLNTTFNHYSKITSFTGYTGAEIARKILDSVGLFDVKIEMVSGHLSDHYDPRKKIVRLSQGIYSSRSIAAIGVAAHEVGHAIQHKEGYKFLKFRNSFVPVVNLGSKIAMPIIFLGFILGAAGQPIAQIGILLFSTVLIFQLITLPVEFNASSRALSILGGQNFLSPKETKDAKKVLNAAALTYVAAATATLLSLIRLILLFGRRSDD